MQRCVTTLLVFSMLLPPALPQLQEPRSTSITLQLNIRDAGLELTFGDDGTVAWAGPVAALLRQLPRERLSKLGVLKLQGAFEYDSTSAAALAPFSSLQQLQCCWLHGCTAANAFLPWLRGITTLTALKLTNTGDINAAAFSTASWRSSLRALSLSRVEFAPAVLAHLPQLESLELSQCKLPEVSVRTDPQTAFLQLSAWSCWCWPIAQFGCSWPLKNQASSCKSRHEVSSKLHLLAYRASSPTPIQLSWGGLSPTSHHAGASWHPAHISTILRHTCLLLYSSASRSGCMPTT